MNAEERERILKTGWNKEQWKDAFKQDKELMRETTRFVNEILANASSEAYKRKRALRADEDLKLLQRATAKFLGEVLETAVAEASARKAEAEGREFAGGNRLKVGQGIANWNNRAREFCTRVLNALCPCVTDALFDWTPYRYRFARP